MKKIFFIATIIFCIGVFLIPRVTYSQDTNTTIKKQTEAFVGSQGANLGTTRDPRVIAASVIRNLLGFIGILVIVYMIYGGFMIMTSAGNDEKITKGKNIIRNGVIGVLLIVSAYALATFIYYVIRRSTVQRDQIDRSVCVERPAGFGHTDPLSQDIDPVSGKRIPYCDEL